MGNEAPEGVGSGCAEENGDGGGDERGEEAERLAELAAARLLDAPAEAEEYLRKALALGAGALPAETLARWHAQLVMVLSGRPGRELELAETALHAAARWGGVSDAGAVHLTFVAARALHRAGRHAEAVELFEPPLATGSEPYPAAEMAVLRGQFGKSLRVTGRYRDAGEQFLEAARLIRGDRARAELQAELVWSAASALDAGGAEDQARLAYLRAAQLWGELDRIGPRSRCLRSAAWLRYWSADSETEREDGIAALGEVLAELEALAQHEPSAQVSLELEYTRNQLADMRER
ncbi:hypothetical protein [Nocardia bhagyanarayanae]|uniref:Tetratricopeptide repeat protein n=1 Tax=Nocardia bhagyanarayanae TaxID=1215925 RepID=A0A543EVM4_9NOCA|nr:hypothetical protein [Nocardia bhagyanarayanae]TQM25628.1 hypothetical protein FB390_5785 [Nocardia bhagyanarayanae]